MPTAESMNVVVPIIAIAGTISTSIHANETPTASASMLVATARGSIVLTENESSSCSSSPKASLIIFAPISASRMNAIQWSMLVMSHSNCFPRR